MCVCTHRCVCIFWSYTINVCTLIYSTDNTQCLWHKDLSYWKYTAPIDVRVHIFNTDNTQYLIHNIDYTDHTQLLTCGAHDLNTRQEWCSMLQCVLYRVEDVLQWFTVTCRDLQWLAVCCSVLRCVLYRVADVLQYNTHDTTSRLYIMLLNY